MRTKKTKQETIGQPTTEDNDPYIFNPLYRFESRKSERQIPFVVTQTTHNLDSDSKSYRSPRVEEGAQTVAPGKNDGGKKNKVYNLRKKNMFMISRIKSKDL